MNERSAASLEQRLGDALDAMVADELPTAITVTELVESGRRRIRRRRTRATFVLSAATVVVTAMVATIGVVVGTGHGHVTADPGYDQQQNAYAGADPTATSPAVSGGPAQGTPTKPMGTSTDPVAPIVAFGWLPADRNGRYETGQTLGNSDVQIWGPGSEFLDVNLHNHGDGLMQGMTLTPAGVVQGHQAYWGTGAPGSAQAAGTSLNLMWQYEPDAWAYMNLANGATDTAHGDMMLQVAQHLKIGPATPTPMPFHLASLPAGMHADYGDVELPSMHGSQAGYAALRLCVTTPCVDAGGLLISQSSTTWSSGSFMTINGAPQLFPGNPPPEQGVSTADGTTVSVGAHQATLWTNAVGATLTFTYGTAEVIIQAAGQEYLALGGKDGFLAFCRSLNWFGADPTHWTTRVVG